MKSATVTWITYNNYGTELQAFALQKYISDLGIENTIISDELILRETRPYLFTSSNVLNMKNSECDFYSRIERIMKNYVFSPKSWIKVAKTFIKAVICKVKHISGIQRGYTESQAKLSAFKNENLNILYNTSLQNVASLNEKFDVFICGSDQIWSVLDCNFNGYYYLDFATKKKFSYAASLGTTKIDANKMEAIREFTKDFYAISVRESQSASQLSETLSRNVEWVLDPTLLFDKAFWDELRRNCPVKRNYVLCYFLENKAWYINYAKALSKYLDVDLYIVPSCEAYAQSRYGLKFGVGPQEFVDLIAKADFVLTDSYHASIFSLLFEKDFLYLKRFKDDDSNCQNIRIESLFELLKIKDTIIDEKTFEEGDIVKPDYVQIKEILEEKRKYSQDYLKGCLL